MSTPADRARANYAPLQKNVFILGYDEQHREDVVQITNLDEVKIHSLLRSEELVNQDHYDIGQLLDKARSILDSHQSVDAIVCHWDFPAVFMQGILCDEYGVPGPTLSSLLKCSHKYWSRLEQRHAVPENTPRFCAVDPFDDAALEKIDLEYPFWIKPIEGYGSMLGFKICNENDFKQAMEETRKVITTLGDPFNTLIQKVDMPPELKEINGNWMLAEQYVKGREFAPEGYVQDGQCHLHGMIDMVIGSNGKSFERYEYPSTMPEDVQRRANDVTKKLMAHMEFDSGCFNIEFFWDEESDRLWIIEINPRISQSHSYLFEKVKGLSNHEVAIHVALGEKPHFDDTDGQFERAAKFLHRRYDKTNLVATRVPERTDIEALQRYQPHTQVHLRLHRGMHLAQMKEQDPYSYVIADILIAANSQQELEQKYQQAAELLPFKFSPIDTKQSSVVSVADDTV